MASVMLNSVVSPVSTVRLNRTLYIALPMAKGIISRSILLTAVSIVLCCIPTDGGPAQTHPAASSQQPVNINKLLADLDR